MNILCVTHADFETPGVIEQWARDQGHRFNIRRPYQGEKLPRSGSFDFLIVMGGPQSPLALDESPYLIDEIALIREAAAANKRIFGFCLGAQLIGEALGAKTLHSPEKEVGVYPIALTPDGMKDPLLRGLPASFPAIHWHSDMPGLAGDSALLAYSEGCPRQIVRYKPLVYGFQCHFEITLDGIQRMIDASPGDLKPSRFVQNASELRAQNYLEINERMICVLDRLSKLGPADYDGGRSERLSSRASV